MVIFVVGVCDIMFLNEFLISKCEKQPLFQEVGGLLITKSNSHYTLGSYTVSILHTETLMV